jgi:hypothetical protein
MNGAGCASGIARGYNEKINVNIIKAVNNIACCDQITISSKLAAILDLQLLLTSSIDA